MNERDLLWLWLGANPHLTSLKKASLLSHFGDIERLAAADDRALTASRLLTSQQCARLSSRADRCQDALRRSMDRLQMHFVHREMAQYPKRLNEIFDPPAVLFARGTIFEEPAVAIVGTRRPTGYGIGVAGMLASRLGGCGMCIVSGLARGIDTAAHAGALSTNARTVAVMACGLDIPYPPENHELMDRIARSGAVVSEYPPGTPPQKHRFPERNRIISGLSLGTIVVEAGLRSGSLITAQCAAEQGRDVLAVPGSVLSVNSEGPNRLIAEGARLVRNEADVLEELAWGIPSRIGDAARPGQPFPDRRRPFPGGESGRCVFEALRMETAHAEALSIRTGVPLPELMSCLLHLELEGFVRRDLTGCYHPAAIS